MNICLKGKVALLSEEGLLVEVMEIGSHFGERALFCNEARRNTAVALAHSDIMMLECTAVMSCMRLDSESSLVIRENATRMYVLPPVWLSPIPS